MSEFARQEIGLSKDQVNFIVNTARLQNETQLNKAGEIFTTSKINSRHQLGGQESLTKKFDFSSTYSAPKSVNHYDMESGW